MQRQPLSQPFLSQDPTRCQKHQWLVPDKAPDLSGRNPKPPQTSIGLFGGTKAAGVAEIALAEFIVAVPRKNGCQHPNQILIAEVLGTYGAGLDDCTADPDRIDIANGQLSLIIGDKIVAEINREVCKEYARKRASGVG